VKSARLLVEVTSSVISPKPLGLPAPSMTLCWLSSNRAKLGRRWAGISGHLRMTEDHFLTKLLFCSAMTRRSWFDVGLGAANMALFPEVLESVFGTGS